MRKSLVLLLVAVLSLIGISGLAKTKLIFAVHWSDYQVEGVKDEKENITVKGLRQYVEEYQKVNPDVEIEIQSVPFDDYLKRILISHTSGVIADVYVLYSLWVFNWLILGSSIKSQKISSTKSRVISSELP